jgi:predicted Zn-dependent peptidase
MRRQLVIPALLAVLLAAAAVAADIPPRPEQLTYPALTFNVPDAKAMRVELANGVPLYVAEDRLLPLVTIQVHFRGGQYLEPAGKEGLASLTGTVWRSGGAGALDAKALDEELDYLAAQLSTSVGPATGMVSLNLLAKDLDRGLALLLDVLQQPRFDEARLATAKDELLAEMKRRNDDTADIEEREWNRLVYGDDHWTNRLATKASVDGITRDDMVAFQKRLALPANLVISAAGDFDRKTLIARLNTTIGAWKPAGERVSPVPQPVASAKPGVYLINKSDVNQGRVSIGHLGARRPLADEAALMVANDVFGGGGFTAWMMQRVRSDEGLAYGAYSDYGIGDLLIGDFRAYFQSKSATCARAAQLTRELMDKLLRGEVSEKELTTSKNQFIERLPRTFESKLRTVTRFATDELVGLPHEHWTTYRQRIAAVDTAAVRAAAQKHIRPEQLIVLVVGNVDEIMKGSPEHPDASIAKFGTVTRLPLRDPMTLKPLAE